MHKEGNISREEKLKNLLISFQLRTEETTFVILPTNQSTTLALKYAIFFSSRMTVVSSLYYFLSEALYLIKK